ncbi:hypothetical protein [Haemophilus parahaemolyticus]|uniref:hypothetical protein n=1 Tax=Haemophilus parahaemolyticus TaxID=735 RepID=UPI0028EA51A7|nr:hypothetical protein [Haemophilus parahaemolyticus]
MSDQYSGPATEEQAQILLQLGFNEPKRPISEHRGKQPMERKDVMDKWAERIIQADRNHRKASSVAYITSHLTFGQAGALIGLLKKQLGIKGRKSSVMELPDRPFLDESQEQVDRLFTNELDKAVTNKLK